MESTNIVTNKVEISMNTKKETTHVYRSIVSLMAVVVVTSAQLAVGSTCTITCKEPTTCNTYESKAPAPPQCFDYALNGPNVNYEHQPGIDLHLIRDQNIPWTCVYTTWKYDSALGVCSTTEWTSRVVWNGTCASYEASTCSY